MSWFLAFAGFAALIILHEFGHFAAAKAVGMRVERFALFFPPLIAKVRRGETEYGIGAIPLGGYVRITGMSPREELPPDVAHRAYYRQAVWKRIVVIAAGPAMNVLIAFLIAFGLLLSQGVVQPHSLRVNQVASKAGATGKLQEGDRIVSIDGHRGYQPGLTDGQVDRRQAELRRVVNSHTCAGKQTNRCKATTPATVVVLRDGERVTLKITPTYDAQLKRMLLGIGYGESQAVGPGRAAVLSGEAMWRVTRLTVTAIARVFYDEQARKQVSGVVGSYERTRQRFEFDTLSALQLLAFISLSLAVVNLFPFLPLDGGHIFWALAEKVRGGPIPFSIMERASVVGFMLVAFLFVIGLTNDIGRLSGQGFGVR